MKLNLYAIYSICFGRCSAVRLRSRLIGSIGAHFFFLAFLGIGFNTGDAGMSGLHKGVDYISFLTPGIIGMTLLFSATFTDLSVLWDREFGFLKEIMVAPVSRLAIILGRTGGATTAIFETMIILISGIVMGMRVQGLGGFILSFVFMVLTAAIFIGMGLAFASKMKDMSGFSLIMNFLIFPLFFLSGAIFPLERFPIAVRTIAYIDPLTFGVDGLRYCFLGASFMSPVLDLMVLTASCLAMLGLGAYLFETSDVD